MYDPLKGSSYIPLPTELQDSKKGLVNINYKNEDNECFRWCHMLFESTRKKFTKDYKIGQEVLLELDDEGFEFPVSIKDYAKLEWKNAVNFNIFGYDHENKQFYPIYVSKECNEEVLNLPLITKDGEETSCSN